MYKKYLWVILPTSMYILSAWIDYQQQSNFVLTQCVTLTLSIHGIASLPSVYWQSEKAFDITGSIAILSMLVRTSTTTPPKARNSLLMILCACWSIRLGLFLLYRICTLHKDSRFTILKKNTKDFFSRLAIKCNLDIYHTPMCINCNL